MKITIAKNAGFCFGVKRATDSLEDAINNKLEGERIYTLGNLIHNAPYNLSLRERGVECISMADVDRIAEEGGNTRVFVRAHGIPKNDEVRLAELSKKYSGFSYIDCTCPFVKKIHKIAIDNSSPENCLVLFGAEEHPEVIGIMSYFEGEKIVLSGASDIEKEAEFFEKNKDKTFIVAAQTTFALS